MAKNKMSSGRQAWLNKTIKILKPMVIAKEHISRRQAIRMVKPITEWERRELDKLRMTANKVIRGESCSVLNYTMFGCTLDHPGMRNEKALFIKELPKLVTDENIKHKTLPEEVDVSLYAAVLNKPEPAKVCFWDRLGGWLGFK